MVASRTPLLLPFGSSLRQPETLGKKRRVLPQGQVKDPRKRAESQKKVRAWEPPKPRVDEQGRTDAVALDYLTPVA